MASSSNRRHSHHGDEFESDDEKDFDGSSAKKVWSVQATELYIRLLDQYKEKLFSPEAQAAHFTVKNSIWSDVTEEMINAGYQLNQPQCRKKLENLKRGFNNCSPRKLVKFISLPNGNRKKVVSTSRSWPFYSQFLPIMNYIAANKVGLDKSVTLKRAAPILAAAQAEQMGLEANGTTMEEEEESVSSISAAEDIFGSSAGEFANGMENGHSEIKSIVASAFDNSDLSGYGSGNGVVTLQGIGGGVQEYYQLQSFNSQPNTDGDIVVQVYDEHGVGVPVPVKVEPIENYDQFETETTTVTELEPPQPIPIPSPTTATPTTLTPPATTAAAGDAGAGAIRRLSSRTKKPTEKLRASGIISITSPPSNNPSTAAPMQNHVTVTTTSNIAPVRQQQTTATTSSNPTSSSSSSHSSGNTNGIAPTPAIAVVAASTSAPASKPMRPELERVLVEELQGVRHEIRALNRNIEKMVDVHNRMNDTLERFLTALRIRLP